MINLIRNELCKIFHKKNIYIYTLIVTLTLIFVSVYSKHMTTEYVSEDIITYTKDLEQNLSNYDLNNKEELEMYVGDRVIIDVNRLNSKYKYTSPERYYIDRTLEALIYNKYQAEYIDKDPVLASEIQLQIDEAIIKLKDYDWKHELEVQKNEIEQRLQELDSEQNQKEIEQLKVDIWCLNYRIVNNIPFSYDSTSLLIDEYKEFANQYMSLVKDEDLIVSKKELIEKREVEKQYHLSLYKLENHKINESQSMIDYIVESLSYVDGLIIVAIVIIAGSIISEEFNKGTIKQLLVKPHSRSKILLSKMIASLIAILAFIIVYNSIFILANCYEYSDFTSIFGTNAVYDFNLGKVKEISVLGHCLYGFISVLPAYLIIFALVVFIGTLTTSTIATVTGAFGIYTFADIFGLWLKPKVLSFLPFQCWDLSPFMFGGLSYNEYSTFGKSLIIDIITIAVLIVLSFIIFKKKEIKNQ